VTSEAITQAHARQTLKQAPQLADATMLALVTSGLPLKHEQLAIQCAAQLFASGWLHCQRPVFNDIEHAPLTGWAMEVLVDDSTHAAIEQLQAVGILPAGLFAWMLAFPFRWAVEAFLSALLRNWLTQEQAQ